jgi:hypothetical protein
MRRASKSAQNEFWRHQQIALATQRVCSFKDMAQKEYKPVLHHFESLAGPAFKQRAVQHTCDVVEAPACQRAPGCEYARDMYHWMSKAGFSDGYISPIMKGKFRGITDLRLLNVGQLKQLHDTVVNRCRAKLGLGDADSRNKKERGISRGQSDNQTRGQSDLKSPRLPVSLSDSPSQPTNGSPPPPVSRSREYVLRPRPAPSSIPRDNIPF